jgi:hypothetical protein
MRVRHPGPPAIVVGYARLPERRLAEAVELLADAIEATRPGGAREQVAIRSLFRPDPGTLILRSVHASGK